MQASKEGTAVSKSGRFTDKQGWGKKCFEDLHQRRIISGRSATRTWSTDFLLREGSNQEEIGKWMTNKAIEGVCGELEQLDRRTTKGDNQPHPNSRVSWTKAGGHCITQYVHQGAATRSQCAWENGRPSQGVEGTTDRVCGGTIRSIHTASFNSSMKALGVQ